MDKKNIASSNNRFGTVPWSQISHPGCYVSQNTGRLYRVPQNGLKEGHSPVIDVVGTGGEEMVVRLTDNAYTPIDALRLLAADADIQPNF